MIRIESIEIEEFRGIKKMMLPLNRDNFGICGPNGTGKSGIVDAIEFALTGDITRLSGSGSEGLTVKAHAPHVDARKEPERSFVRITAFAPSLNKKITIERRVSAPAVPIIEPNDSKVIALVSQLGSHPEFALSRREIVKYVITPAGQRAKDVQSLLRLEQIEKVRLALQKIANDEKKDAQTAVTEDERAKKDLLLHLSIATLSKADLLQAINARRTTLQLQTLADLEANTSLKEGVVSVGDTGKPKSKIIKAVALTDLASLNDNLASVGSTPLVKARADALAIISNLTNDAEALRAFRTQVLVQQGLKLVDDDLCPLCDVAWQKAELEAHLQEKLAKASKTAEQLQVLEDTLQSVIDNLSDITNAVGKAVAACGLLDPKIDTQIFLEFAEKCTAAHATLSQVCSEPSLIEAAAFLLSESETDWSTSKELSDALSEMKAALDKLPDPSKEEEARDFLIIAQERYDRCKATRARKDETAARSALSLKVSETYGSTSKAVLEGIYDKVEKDFSDCYRIINHDDEGKFDGKLTPSVGKLAFDVDFYGRGKFPPGAYHSEGHQDSMGLCLYLALVRHTLGDSFTFAVLDDVLMSVDAGHRREVCTLLKTKFPKTQFILTTHDPVWLKFMKTENLIQGSVIFGGWSVDSGPQVWKDSDAWQQIADHLAKNDVPAAASVLRRYLEYTATVLADKLRAPVEFHGNGSYDLGDLLPSVIRTWRAHLKAAKEAAKSWGADTKALEAREADAAAKAAKTNVEQWMINKAVHFNEWANLQKTEFEVVVAAYRALLDSMRCDNSACKEDFYISPPKGPKEALRCGCGQTNLNLNLK